VCKKLQPDEKFYTGALKPVKINTRQIALMAIFAALYTVLRLTQTIPMIGVQGGRFSLGDIVAPLYGILLGPYLGGFSVILGTFLAIALGRPVTFLFLDFLPATINAIALGFLIRRKWLPVVFLNAALLLVFLLNPLTSFFIEIPIGGTTIQFPFAWMHIAAFIVLLSPLGRKAGQWVESLKTKSAVAGLAILAFIGTMMQHLTGNILYEAVLNQFYVVLGQPPIIPASAYPVNWAVVFFVYPWERLILIVFTVLVGLPLIRVLRKSVLRTSDTQTSNVPSAA
jgi:uncharacterized membrane protein